MDAIETSCCKVHCLINADSERLLMVVLHLDSVSSVSSFFSLNKSSCVLFIPPLPRFHFAMHLRLAHPYSFFFLLLLLPLLHNVI